MIKSFIIVLFFLLFYLLQLNQWHGMIKKMDGQIQDMET